MLCKDPYSADFLVGLTEDEWTKAKVPRWRYEKLTSKWRWMGPTTPEWDNATVDVEEVSGEHKPSTLRFARPEHHRRST